MVPTRSRRPTGLTVADQEMVSGEYFCIILSCLVRQCILLCCYVLYCIVMYCCFLSYIKRKIVYPCIYIIFYFYFFYFVLFCLVLFIYFILMIFIQFCSVFFNPRLLYYTLQLFLVEKRLFRCKLF